MFKKDKKDTSFKNFGMAGQGEKNNPPFSGLNQKDLPNQKLDPKKGKDYLKNAK